MTHDGVQQQLAEVVDALPQQRRQRDVYRQRLRMPNTPLTYIVVCQPSSWPLSPPQLKRRP